MLVGLVVLVGVSCAGRSGSAGRCLSDAGSAGSAGRCLSALVGW